MNLNLLQALGWAVFNSLWQMAALWVAYQLITTVFRVNRSSVKGMLATLFLFSGFAWFVFTFVSLLLDGSTTVLAAGIFNTSQTTGITAWLNAVLPGLSVVYLILLVLPVFNFIRNYRYVQVIRSQGLSKADVYWRIFAQKISSQMGIQRPVSVWMSGLVASPVTIGYLKPVILLPLATINHLSTGQTEAILLHELAHIRRHDYFINLIAKFIRTLLYFNPFTRAFGKIIEKEREKSCDETVLQFQYEPHQYASALLSLEKAAGTPEVVFAVPASGKKSDFRERIEWILGIGKKPAFSLVRAGGVLLALLCFTALNTLLILNKPFGNSPSGNGSGAYSLLSSPFQFSGEQNDKPVNIKERPSVVGHDAEIVSASEQAKEATAWSEAASAWDHSEDNDAAGLSAYYVNNLEQVFPQLNPQQEKIVQEAVAESKKVFQEITWKEVEKDIADAMTLAEKTQVKQEYQKAIGTKLNLEKVANRLRVSFDQVNWENINGKLDGALAQIQLDSLQNAYTIALSNLSDLQVELSGLGLQGIPDSDVTVKLIEVKKQELESAIHKIRALRGKKIVHL